MSLSRRHFLEPAWQRPGLPATCRPPQGLLQWLVDDSSLTRRLQQACTGTFRVELLSQRYGRPLPSEVRSLSAAGARPEHALVRQVFLCCDAQRWVFARTVIPIASMTGPNRPLAHLGTRPLGAYLFGQARLRREPLELACAAAGRGPLVACREDGAGQVWGRRSVFYLNDRPLLVSEFFLSRFVEALR